MTNSEQQATPPEILDLPVGLEAAGTRRETDAMGAVDVPADRYWGAQTQRSLEHFTVGDDHMPQGIHHAYGYVKMAAALVNGQAGRLPQWMAGLIARVAAEVIAGRPRRALPALRLADRLGHADQHERQRGHQQPRDPAARRHARQQGAGPPQRPRQPARSPPTTASRPRLHIAAVLALQNHAAARARRNLHAALDGQGTAVGRHRQDRPHPPAGRDVPLTSARSGPATRPRSSAAIAAAASRRCRACTNSPPAARRSAPA